ncbi:MAG: sugar transferase, partial [Maricaulaceae bacterium]
MEYTLEHGAAADTGHASRELISNPPLQSAANAAVVEDIAPRLRARTERRTLGRPEPTSASICLAKRAMDIVIAGSVLIFTSPLLVLIAVLIRLQDGGPVVFRHERIGRDGRKFGCLKFRTMHTDADARLERHLAEYPEAAAEWAADQKLRKDPRVIGFIGRALRTTSLDELPQIINILRGEMSVVGPRPIVEGEIERYEPY